MMIKQLMLLILLSQLGLSKTYTLQSILKSSDEKGVLAKTLEQERLALDAKNRADTASDPFNLSVSGAKAVPNLGEYGYEYTMGVSKTIMLHSIQEQERNIAGLNNQAYLIEGEKRILNFKNELKNRYHQHCLDAEQYKSIYQSYADLSNLYKKKQKAYQYKEISKIELMQIESEKNRLYAQVQSLKMRQEISKQGVLMLGRVGSGDNIKLSCRDMYPIRTFTKLNDTFSLSKEAYEKRLASTKIRFKRYSHALESVNVSGQYGKELDIDRYTIGISLPLNFSSERSEKERAAALYRGTALAYRYEQDMIEKKSLLLELKMTLKSQMTMVRILSKNYQKYKKMLLPLVRKSYDLGDTSLIEYLLNRRKLYTLMKELYAAKKAYYETLFTLYTLIEKKD